MAERNRSSVAVPLPVVTPWSLNALPGIAIIGSDGKLRVDISRRASERRTTARKGRRMRKFSPGVMLLWQLAAAEATAARRPEIEPEHLLLGLCKICDAGLD